MESRGYANEFFDKKLRRFLIPKAKNITDHTKRIKAKVPFNGITGIHDFICKMMERARIHYNLKKPYIVPDKKVKDYIKTKRQIISSIAALENRPDPVCKKRKRCPEICKLCEDMRIKRSKLSHVKTTLCFNFKDNTVETTSYDVEKQS